jgi:hypothetical protein
MRELAKGLSFQACMAGMLAASRRDSDSVKYLTSWWAEGEPGETAG